MIKVKFNDSDAFIDVSFSRYSEHIVTLVGDVPTTEVGFCTYRLSGEQLGDFSDYTTVYRVLENCVQYSNDGSTYVEPTPEPIPEPTPEPTPSEFDLLEAQVLYTAMMTDTLLEE